ncbi:hypothetical protein GGR92_003635 [Spirosoma lacussanchae]
MQDLTNNVQPWAAFGLIIGLNVLSFLCLLAWLTFRDNFKQAD